MDDRKKTRAQLIEELQKLREEREAAQQASSGQTPTSHIFYDIMQSANDAVLSINTGGIIVFFNRKAEDMFGYTAAEIVGGSSRMSHN